MSAQMNKDFASLLDELIAAAEWEKTPPTTPKIPFDYLAVAEELHSGRIRVTDDAAAAEYRTFGGEDDEAVASGTQPAPEAMPATEPEAIAEELGLDKARAADFTRIRRSFAFANHPDRVAPHLRERAMIRMKVANMLIDEAKRRAMATSRR